jgi:EAL domain-containing protein (putative c-di-GMP-specific phosphodiesterase class I)/CheY-like chemotaxis protein
MDDIRVLIADDDPEVLELLGRVIADDPSMEVVASARGADEAIDLATQHHPDVAVLDVRMPGGGGPRAARAIRQQSPDTDIIAFSTFEAPESVLGMLEAGARGYVSKSDPAPEIARAIRRCREGETALSARIRDRVAESLAGKAVRRTSGTPIGRRRERIFRFIDGDDLDVVFQPIVDLDDGTIVAVEALSRFATSSPRTPDAWFREARDVGLGVELEITAARLALRALPRLPWSVSLSLNFSPEALASTEFAALMGHHPVDRLVVEVTEQTDGALSMLQDALAPWRWGGLLVAVDDTGAGYSTLGRIVQLQPDLIKLDIALTRGVESDPGRQVLIEKLQEYATSVGATLIAEGVETDDQIVQLRALGVRLGQGYRLGRPGPLPAPSADGVLVWKGRHAFRGVDPDRHDRLEPVDEVAGSSV